MLLQVRGTRARVSGKLIVTETKTSRSRRVVPLSHCGAAAARRTRQSLTACVRPPAPQERHEHEKPEEIGTNGDPLIEAQEGGWMPSIDLRHIRQGQTEQGH